MLVVIFLKQVALSRIISLEGLFLKNFDPLKIKINKKVHNFYEKYRINHEVKREIENK
jgi:hypothetical protein